MAIGEAIARRGIQKQLLPRDPRRRPAAQQGRLPVLEEARPQDHVPRRRGDRRGGAASKFRKRVSFSKNFEALEFARSLGIMVAINIIADPDWDRERFRGDPRVVPGDPRDRQHQREHALPGHRELAHRVAQAHHARLPPVRHPARRAADQAAAARVLRGAGRDAAGAQSQAPGRGADLGRRQERGRAAREGPDELRQDAVQVRQRLRSRSCSTPTTSARSTTRCPCRPRRARPWSATRSTSIRPPAAAGASSTRRRSASSTRRASASPTEDVAGSASGVTVRTRSRRRAARRGAAR